MCEYGDLPARKRVNKKVNHDGIKKIRIKNDTYQSRV